MLLRSGLVPFRLAIAFFLALSLASCWKKRGEAVVVAKEHIDVAQITPSRSPGASPANEEPVYREMAPDEIDVDGIVMKKEVRGTSKDPRAGSEEKWLIKVEMVGVSRSFNIYTDRAHYDKVKVGDRIKVRYSEGKYTGTVWGSEIED
jgi:antitoxin (DNA-binding transcriptional repressor) of toxin-antitoxin stability system